MIHPKKDDIPRLKALWLECFPDDGGYCDFFFDNRFIPERITALESSGEICGAVYFFDAYFAGKDGKKYPFLMAYAAGVAKSFRGRGGMFGMYAHTCEEAFRNGIYGLAAFSTDELIEAYDRHGFKRFFGIYRITCEVEESVASPEWSPCSYSEFKERRENFLQSKKSFFGWEEASLAFMYKDVFTSGEVLCCERGGERFYAVCSFSGEELVIRETDYPLGEVSALFSGISKHFGTRQITLYSDVPVSGVQCERMYYGHYMLSEAFPYPDDVQGAYINIIAD